MAWASTCPAAVAGLLAAWGRSAGLAGVLVSDEISEPGAAADEVLCAGYAGEQDDTAAGGTLTAEGYSGGQDREQYVVHCCAVVRNGDEDQAAARARVFALLAAAGQALASDRKLGGTVMTALVTSWAFRDEQTDGGAQARIRFDVTIDAYTNR